MIERIYFLKKVRIENDAENIKKLGTENDGEYNIKKKEA